LGKLFALYGRQEVAERVLSAEEAAEFTVAREMHRRQRRKRGAAGVGVLLAVGLCAYLLATERSHPRYHVREEFSLDENITATILDKPRCQLKSTLGRPNCLVRIRFRNVSHRQLDLGPGSFGPYGESYYAELLAQGDHYDYDNTDSSFSTFVIYPGQSTMAELRFDVPDEVTVIDELRLTPTGNGDTRIVSFVGN
jgi:hypothetical protein